MAQIPSRVISLASGQQCLVRTVQKGDALDSLTHTKTVGGETDFLNFGSEGIQSTLEEQEKQIERWQSLENNLFIVAEVDGKIVATLGFTGGPRARNRHTGEFGLAVRKAYWRRGVGKALLSTLVDWAKSAGIKKINLRVRPDNLPAIALYKGFGFREEGRWTREYLIDGEFHDNTLMGLQL